MDSYHPSSRKFSRLLVGKCHAQTATDRFGSGAKNAVRDRERASFGLAPLSGEIPFTWPGVESETEEAGEPSIYKRVPSMQPYRNNLTALSQVYNLYLVAYQGRIFAYRPRSVPKQSLPSEPDLQLNPKPTKVSRSIGEYLDTRRPHIVNHLVTGLLGDDEVLVVCFDDGDVVAYYTKEISERVSQVVDEPEPATGCSTRSRAVAAGAKLRPFLHENVGQSAWGLAVHAKSRLIAVSSNHHEITVFAPAVTREETASNSDHGTCECSKCCQTVEERVQLRVRNWRIVIALGPDADNIPNVTFMDDDSGNAEKVCAVDINGVVWMGHIWSSFKAPVRIPGYKSLSSEEFFHDPSRGWGIAALQDSSFMKVRTVEEMLGMDPAESDVSLPTLECPQPMVNVRKCLHSLEGNPCRPRDNGPDASRPENGLHGFIQDQLLHVFAQTQANIDDEISLEGAELLLDTAGEVDWEEEDMNEMDDGEDEVYDDVHFDDDYNGGLAEGDVSEPTEDENGDEEDSHDGEGQGQPMNEISTSAVAPQVFSAMSAMLAGPFQQAFGQLHQAVGQLEQAIDSLENSTVLQGGGAWTLSSSTIPTLNKLPIIGNEMASGPLTSGRSPVRLDMLYVPYNGYAQIMPQETTKLVRFLKRGVGTSRKVLGQETLGEQSSQRYHIIRTYEKDLELRSLGVETQKTRKEIGVLCPDAVKFRGFVEPGLRHYFHATGRLSMVVHIPELYLVAIGSPTGRVVLLTPTKLASRSQHSVGTWAYGFRVEYILPHDSDEKEHRKTLRPLHGLAVGPLQQGEKVSVDERANKIALPKRYRLMMHYRTHDILTYEIERDGQTGKLCMF